MAYFRNASTLKDKIWHQWVIFYANFENGVKNSRWRIDEVLIPKAFQIQICQYFSNATTYEFGIWQLQVIFYADSEYGIQNSKWRIDDVKNLESTRNTNLQMFQ